MASGEVLSRGGADPRPPASLSASERSQVFEHCFKLRDAQELVARQSGFESWQALKAGVEAMTEKADGRALRPTLCTAEPQLFVTDINTSCAFFTDKLGFKVAFVYGEPLYYGQVMRDGARLNLRCVEAPVIDSRIRDRENLLSASMTVATASEIKQLFLELQTAGVAFHQTLKKEPWGSRNFIVKDPAGNLLLFSGPAE